MKSLHLTSLVKYCVKLVKFCMYMLYNYCIFVPNIRAFTKKTLASGSTYETTVCIHFGRHLGNVCMLAWPYNKRC